MFVECIRPGDIKTRFSVSLYCCCSSRFFVGQLIFFSHWHLLQSQKKSYYCIIAYRKPLTARRTDETTKRKIVAYTLYTGNILNHTVLKPSVLFSPSAKNHEILIYNGRGGTRKCSARQKQCPTAGLNC